MKCLFIFTLLFIGCSPDTSAKAPPASVEFQNIRRPDRPRPPESDEPSLPGAPDDDMEEFENGDLAAPENQDSEFSPQVTIGMPQFAGTGCAPDQAAASLSPDKRTLSILFPSFQTESRAPLRDIKTCQMMIPFAVPEGFQMAVVRMDYRGFVSVANGGRAKLQARYLFPDALRAPYQKLGVNRRKVFQGPIEQNFYLSSNLRRRKKGPLPWSRCGESFMMEVHQLLMSRTNDQSEVTLAALDSVDMGSASQYHVQWRRCRNDRPQRGDR